MDIKYSIISTFLLLSVVYVRAQDGTFDIVKYGAQPNADITQALTDAWKAACEATAPTTLMIPPETYMLGAITLSGPCKAAVTIQLAGTLKAPEDPATFKADQEWVTLQHIDLLTLTGGGTLNGLGATAWGQNDCHKTGQCSKLPINLSLNSITNSLIQGITSADSKLFHVNVLGCNNLTFVNFTISAPETSKNTDGIHIGRSNGINITDSIIKTGDDCVSIGDGSQQISVTKVTCGPGHGISVGSLGRYPNEQDVIGITVKNCTFIGTMNGVRVKTWPASPPGIASDLHFEDLIMDNVGNPVLIDQEYCPYNQCTQNVPSKVKISKVSFKNIRGTSSTQLAVKLVCSKGFPCEGVEVGDIDLTYNGKEGPAISQCANLLPTFSGKLNPPECTAQAPGQAPVQGVPGQVLAQGAPGQAPAQGAPGQAPAQGAPGQAPAQGVPDQALAQGTSAQAPAQGAPGQALGVPAEGAPSQALGVPAQGAPGQVPAQGAPGQALGVPAQGAPGQVPAQGAPGQVPAQGAPGQALAQDTSNQAPAQGAPGQALTQGALATQPPA